MSRTHRLGHGRRSIQIPWQGRRGSQCRVRDRRYEKPQVAVPTGDGFIAECTEGFEESDGKGAVKTLGSLWIQIRPLRPENSKHRVCEAILARRRGAFRSATHALQILDEEVDADSRLFQNAVQSSGLQAWMHRYHAPAIAEPKNDVASTLTNNYKSNSLQSPKTIRAADARQLRHRQPRRWSEEDGRLPQSEIPQETTRSLP